MTPTKLIFVGGFLGAGKTTLLWTAAQRLAARGQRVGLITNDQAPNLVDTGLLARQGFDVREVAGSCFCCNFNALIGAASTLRNDVQADVLIGEPVGSCTDLSATILQPLKDRHAREFAIAPLSVLVDSGRVQNILSGSDNLHSDAAYIYRKQIEEADIIVVNKSDLIFSGERDIVHNLLAKEFPGKAIQFLSALTGEGIDEWLEAILSGGDAGNSIPHVDYDRYARGEAVLGWLNIACDLTAMRDPVDSQEFCRRLMQTLKDRFAERSAEVGHFKIMLETSEGICVGNLTSSHAEVSIRDRNAGAFLKAALVINARVEISPEELETIVHGALDRTAHGRLNANINQLQSLSPGSPVPTHRYANVI